MRWWRSPSPKILPRMDWTASVPKRGNERRYHGSRARQAGCCAWRTHRLPPQRERWLGYVAMNESAKDKRYVVDLEKLPPLFPTHRHNPEFWEYLGRTVATFGFLEEVLGKAIFSFPATTRYQESEIDAAYKSWLPTLERALTDPLRNLIDAYGKAVRNNSAASNENLDDLLGKLKEASTIRNVLCHASWRLPDDYGRSLPFFVNRQKMVFDTPIDIPFLKQTQQAVAELACAVVSTVTPMGWQFPGSNGPGKIIYEKRV
jgi:hypothetical protein